MTSFSSRSRFVDLAAPGQDITVATALDDSWAPEAGTSFSVAARRGRGRLGLDGAARARREPVVRGDAPLGRRYRRAGRDDASGYGLLNVPAALAYPAPVPDPFEPNDDVDYVTPGRTFDNGIPPLTTRAKPSTTLVARLAAVEDPRDVYRVFVPARGSDHGQDADGRRRVARPLGADDADRTEATPNRNRLAHGVASKGTVTLTYKNPVRPGRSTSRSRSQRG